MTVTLLIDRDRQRYWFYQHIDDGATVTLLRNAPRKIPGFTPERLDENSLTEIEQNGRRDEILRMFSLTDFVEDSGLEFDFLSRDE